MKKRYFKNSEKQRQIYYLIQNSFINNIFEIVEKSLILYFENSAKLEIENYAQKIKAIQNGEIIYCSVENIEEIIDNNFSENISCQASKNLSFFLLKTTHYF